MGSPVYVNPFYAWLIGFGSTVRRTFTNIQLCYACMVMLINVCIPWGNSTFKI